MDILCACEESQAVTIELRKLGHRAFSCDLQECSGGHPEWHIQGDVLDILNPRPTPEGFVIVFTTMDGVTRKMLGRWDAIIAFPPCTYLTGAGAANIPKHPDRIAKGWDAVQFFNYILNANCEKIAIENPPPMKRFGLPKYSQIVRPWMFGQRNNKAICLWLKGLPLLIPTEIVDKDDDIVTWVYKKTGQRKSCSKWYNTNTNNHSLHRSKTFTGVAHAMATQWFGK